MMKYSERLCLALVATTLFVLPGAVRAEGMPTAAPMQGQTSVTSVDSQLGEEDNGAKGQTDDGARGQTDDGAKGQIDA